MRKIAVFTAGGHDQSMLPHTGRGLTFQMRQQKMRQRMSKHSSSPRSNSQSNKKRKSAKVEFRGYVNYSPTQQDKAEFDTWASSGEVWYDAVPSLLQSNYKLSVAYDDNNEAFRASVFAQNPADVNAGWCLTMRAADPVTAIMRVLFVHEVVMGGDWSDWFQRKLSDW